MLISAAHQRWADCHILRSRSSLIFKNSVQVQPQSEKISKCKVQVQMKSKKFEKCILFTTKMPHFFFINSVQIRSGSSILKWFTLRIQSKFNKTCYNPDSVQSKSRPMLISAAHQRCAWTGFWIFWIRCQAKFLTSAKFLINSQWRHNFTEPEPNLNQFSLIKYSNLETELNVMKNLNKIIKSKD